MSRSGSKEALRQSHKASPVWYFSTTDEEWQQSETSASFPPTLLSEDGHLQLEKALSLAPVGVTPPFCVFHVCTKNKKNPLVP